MEKSYRQHIDMEKNLPYGVRVCMETLAKAGYEAFLVGGAVRDLLLGIIPDDFDIATNAIPSAVQALFGRNFSIPTGIKHGTVTVISHNITIEVTTYRVEGEYSDLRRPDQVSFSQSIEEDVQRRDFTINALAMTRDGKIVDYVGGLTDLEEGNIRAVGSPNKRFAEDPLRILRALRFMAVLDFTVEEKTMSALRENSNLLNKIASERIWKEFVGLICGQNVAAVLLTYSDIIGRIFPDVLPMIGYKQYNPHHRFDVWEHTVETVKNTPPQKILRLAAFFHDIGKPHCFTRGSDGIGHFYGHQKISAEITRQIMTSYRSDHLTREAVALLVLNHDIPIEVSEKGVKRRLCQFGTDAFNDLLSLKEADTLAQSDMSASRLADFDQIRHIADRVQAEKACFSLNSLAVNGNDILALGIEPGPMIGMILSKLLLLVIEGTSENERDALLAIVKEMRRSGMGE